MAYFRDMTDCLRIEPDFRIGPENLREVMEETICYILFCLLIFTLSQ